jgi:hypothetical protein
MHLSLNTNTYAEAKARGKGPEVEMDTQYRTGLLVEHMNEPAWGPGKVVHVGGGYVHVLFRDVPDRKAKMFSGGSAPLQAAASQSDPILDNLPPLVQKDRRWYLRRDRLTPNQSRQIFLDKFPGGFTDPRYLGSKNEGERNYKWWAHERFVHDFGGGQSRQLLDAGDFKEIRRRALGVLGQVNLLSPYESAAFREATEEDKAAARFFTALFNLLEAPKQSSDVFNPYADAIRALPARAGRARVATWPVATVFPFLAQPDRHMLLKPERMREAAERLGFDLRYDSNINWATYSTLLRMAEAYMALLRDLGPRDFIDIQSFIYVSCGWSE